MNRSTALVRQEPWKQIIAACNARKSGTVKEWCEANGIVKRQYYYWVKRIRDTAADQMTTVSLKPEAKAAVSQFVEITPCIESCMESLEKVHRENASITIQIEDCRVELSAGSINEENLSKVIRVIRHA